MAVKDTNTECRYVLWLQLKNVCPADVDNILFGIVYIPPENSKYSSPDCFLEIEQELLTVSKNCNNICLVGDYNARTGNLCDFITTDDFLANVQNCDNVFQTLNEQNIVTFETLQIPFIRKVTDMSSNNFGYKLIDFCINNNIFIVNGRMGTDKLIGSLTCNNSSTVDYVLSSASLFYFIKEFEVLCFCNLYLDVHNFNVFFF